MITGSQDGLVNAYALPESTTSSEQLLDATSSEPTLTGIGHTANVCCLDGNGSDLGESLTLRPGLI